MIIGIKIKIAKHPHPQPDLLCLLLLLLPLCNLGGRTRGRLRLRTPQDPATKIDIKIDIKNSVIPESCMFLLPLHLIFAMLIFLPSIGSIYARCRHYLSKLTLSTFFIALNRFDFAAGYVL